MDDLVNFHQHSHYSLLDGCSTEKQIVSRCKELGMKYCCLSDHGNVIGHIPFYDECHEQGLIPILGTELYCKDEFYKYDTGKPKGWHLCIWAFDFEGLQNVWAISSNSYYRTGEGHRTPNTYLEDMEGHGKGVGCTSACLGSYLSECARHEDEENALAFVEKMQSIFDWFAIEIHTNSMSEQHKVNLWLYNFAVKHGIPTVYAVDAHYALEEDAEFHDLWLGCQTKKCYDEDHWKMDHEYYIQGREEVRERLAYLGEEAVDRCFAGVGEFLSKVQEYEISTERKIPKFPLPEGWSDSESYARYLVEKGILTRVLGCKILPGKPGEPIDTIHATKPTRNVDIQPYLTQLVEEEFPIVFENGLADYFLVVQEYVNWARGRMMVGPGRGSVCASVMAYAMGIDDIDPIGKGLIYSRFLTNERVAGSMPDIDVDFDENKPMIAEHLKEVYGDDHVTAVGTTSFFSLKSALKAVCRYYRVPFADSNRMTSIAGQLEEMSGMGDWRGKLPMLDASDGEFIQGYMERFPQIFKYAERMIGLAANSGKHAAGYVISPEPLTGMLPIRRSDNDEIISQCDKNAVERMGFLKADVLGLTNLTVLKKIAAMVKVRRNIIIDYSNFSEDAPDDITWKVYATGNTLGIFQSDGVAHNVCMQLKPVSIMDMAIIVALARPGVIGAGCWMSLFSAS